MTPREAFRRQAEICASMGSPFTAQLCRLVAERIQPGRPVADRMLGWPGDPAGSGDALPLRLAGALHALVLAERDAGLAAAYPPHAPSDEALWRAIASALDTHDAAILARLDGPPQTNEPMRSAALAPGLIAVAEATGLPLVLSEIGASAGLNTIWDRYAYRFGDAAWGDPASPVTIAPDWRGAPPPLGPGSVASRSACDLAPVDLHDPAARLRLLSFVWADQAPRLDRLRAAMALAREAGVAVERAAADTWLANRLADTISGTAHVAYHSIMWQYLPEATQIGISALIAEAGARASATAPLAWLRLERDTEPHGAGLRLTLWPGGREATIARADFHGSWVEWRGWP